MNYPIFSTLFIISHTSAYFIAGIIAYNISQDLYQGKNRLLDYLVDPNQEGEAKFTLKKVLPAQIIRSLLMSIILYPLLGAITKLSFTIKFLFFTGLMLIYTDLTSTPPFPSNIEGLVYMKPKYIKKKTFWKTQTEMIIYSTIFALILTTTAF